MRKLLQSMVGLTLREEVRNGESLKRTGAENVIVHIAKVKWNLAGRAPCIKAFTKVQFLRLLCNHKPAYSRDFIRLFFWKSNVQCLQKTHKSNFTTRKYVQRVERVVLRCYAVRALRCINSTMTRFINACNFNITYLQYLKETKTYVLLGIWALF